jgi:hypothetical protein
MTDELYAKGLERENAQLRKMLEDTQKELDDLKNSQPSGTNGLLNFSSSDLVIKCSPQPQWIVDRSITIGESRLTAEDIKFMTDVQDRIRKFDEATLWKKITMLWAMLVTKKTLKKE